MSKKWKMNSDCFLLVSFLNKNRPIPCDMVIYGNVFSVYFLFTYLSNEDPQPWEFYSRMGKKNSVFPVWVLGLVPPAGWREKLLPNSVPLSSLERGNRTNFLAVLQFELSAQPWALPAVCSYKWPTHTPPHTPSSPAAVQNRLTTANQLSHPINESFQTHCRRNN